MNYINQSLENSFMDNILGADLAHMQFISRSTLQLCILASLNFSKFCKNNLVLFFIQWNPANLCKFLQNRAKSEKLGDCKRKQLWVTKECTFCMHVITSFS